MTTDGEEFDIEEFLDSATAVRVQDAISVAVYRGIMKAFWMIFAIQFLLGAGICLDSDRGITELISIRIGVMVRSAVDGKEYPAEPRTVEEVMPEYRARFNEVTERAKNMPEFEGPGIPSEKIFEMIEDVRQRRNAEAKDVA